MTRTAPAKLDLSTWLTKQEVSQQLGVSSKTVEKLEKAGKLQSAKRPNKTGPALMVYHPDDVAREAQARQAEPQPFMIPASHVSSVVSGSVSEVPEGLPKPDQYVAYVMSLADGLRQAAQHPKPEPRLFLTMKEASHLTGLTQRYLRERIEEGTLKGIRDGKRLRIRRKDLEEL